MILHLSAGAFCFRIFYLFKSTLPWLNRLSVSAAGNNIRATLLLYRCTA